MAKDGRVVVFLEDAYNVVVPVNQWVAGAGQDSDLPKAMAGIFKIHRTAEFAQVLKAARGWNAKVPKGAGIEFYGVDTQLHGGTCNPVGDLRTFLAVNAVDLEPDLAIVNAYLEGTDSRTPDALSRFEGAAVRIRLTVSRILPTAPGQPEAAVMANSLVCCAEMKGFARGPMGEFELPYGESPADIAYSGVRDGGVAENIKILMAAKVPSSDRAVFWAHNGHVGRIGYLDMDPVAGKRPCVYGNTGSILDLWLGDGYAPLAAVTGMGSFRARLMEDSGKFTGFQTVNIVRPILPDSMNAIATKTFTTPVFFTTASLPFMETIRPEFYNGALTFVDHPDYDYARTIPGLAYFGMISFPVSTAAAPAE